MTPEELREAVARSLWTARKPPYPFENVSGDELIDLLEEADAALRVVREALREPTPEMLRAAHHEEDQCAIHNYGGSPRVKDIWVIMLAASALGDK